MCLYKSVRALSETISLNSFKKSINSTVCKLFDFLLKFSLSCCLAFV